MDIEKDAKDVDEGEKVMESEGGIAGDATEGAASGAACARCGTPQADWVSQEGVIKDGKTFCSTACAESTAPLKGEAKGAEPAQPEKKAEPARPEGRRHGGAPKGVPSQPAQPGNPAGQVQKR